MAGAQGPTLPATAEEMEMDIELSRQGWGPSFEFAFDSERFSDQMLRIEIVSSGEVAGGSLPEPACHREEEGDAEQSIDSSSTMVGTPVLRLKTIHINSAILAVRSPFFLKLFSNGMKESDETHPTLRIADSEENALMEILSFMYSGKLTTTEPTLLLNILMAADKYEVLSCVSYCSQLLTRLPMTTEIALLYLEHSCSISVPVAAKEFLVNKYKDVLESTGELMKFPLAGIEAIFLSTGLRVPIEDNIYDFMLSWARARYPELEERRKVLSSRLLPLVRFSHMSRNGLRNVLLCTDDDIDHDQVNKCISEVLLHKAYPSHLYADHAVDVATWQPEQRAYLFRPVKLVAFDGACPHVIAYWDLKREEFSQFVPSKQNHHTGILSHPIHHAGLNLFLVAQCVRNQVSGLCSFGLFLYASESSTRVTLQYEFAARTKMSGKFVSRLEGKDPFTAGSMLGCSDVFGTAWSNFIADDNLFIDGVLHLRVDWTVVQESEL